MTLRAKTILATIVFLIVGILVAGGVYHRKAIGEWFKDNFPTKQTVDQLKKENEEKAKQLADKDKEINNLNSQLTTMQTNLTSLNTSLNETTNKLNQKEIELNTATTQRATLLSSITEIDNKINSTTDQTEIANLEEKKTAILTQIDTLNTEISTLTQEKETLATEKTQLQNQITTLNSQIITLETEKAELESEVERLKSATTGNVTITENELEIIPNSALLDAYIYNNRFGFRYNSSNFNQAMSGSDTVDAVVCNDKYDIKYDESLRDYSFIFRDVPEFSPSQYNFVRDWSITYNLYDYYGNELDLSSCPENFYLWFERITKELNHDTSTINVTAYLQEDCTMFLDNFSSTDLTTLTGKYSYGTCVVDFDTLTDTNVSFSYRMEIYNNYYDAIYSSGSAAGQKHHTYLCSYVESSDLLLIFSGSFISRHEKVVEATTPTDTVTE